MKSEKEREPRGSRLMCLGGAEAHLTADRDAAFITPLADAGVADFEDGLVGPFLRRGGQRGAVDVVRRGVGDEVDITSSAIDHELLGIQEGSQAFPTPADADVVTADLKGEAGLHEAEVGGGGDFTLDAEGLADAFVVGGVALDEVAQVTEALLHTRSDGDDGTGVGRSHGDAGGGHVTALADDVFPGGALLAVVGGDVLAAEDLIEVIGIGGLGRDLCGGESEQGIVVADVVFEGEELSSEVSVLLFDGVRFSHGLVSLTRLRGGETGGGGIGDVAFITGLQEDGGRPPAEVFVPPLQAGIESGNDHGCGGF